MKKLERYRQECHRLRNSEDRMAKEMARQEVYHALELRHTWGPIMRHMRQIKEVLDRAKAQGEADD